MSQIVGISSSESIAEVALKCGDPFYKDFPKNIYSQAVYRAERSIAKEYGIMNRIWEYTNTDGSEEIDIGPLNFNGEWWVTITPEDDAESTTPNTLIVEQNTDDSYTYKRKQWEELLDADTSYSYAINYVANKYSLRYSNPSDNDVVKIYYVSSIAGEEDYEFYDDQGEINLIPAIPNKFHEETLRRAAVYMAQLGIATFDREKAARYVRVLELYQQIKDKMPESRLERDRPWITIKTFCSIYP